MTDKTADKITYRAAVWCDGGARPTNPGYGGYGIHGYVYSDQPTKKGIGHPDWVASEYGYIKKDQAKDKPLLDVVSYFDIFATVPEICSNNVSEAKALIHTINTLDQNYPDYKISDIRIYTDNDGVVTSCNGLLEKWHSLGWKKTNGEPLAFVDLRKEMLTSLNKFKETHGIEVLWTKGHDGHLGNESADTLATMGCLKRKRGEHGHKTIVQSAAKYWNMEYEKHPLIAHKTLYFSTTAGEHTQSEYYMGSHGKDDELAGKRMGDGYHAYVKLNEADPILEVVITEQCIAVKNKWTIVLGKVDNILSKTVYALLQKYGKDAIYQRSENREDLWTVTKVPLTRVLIPLGIGYRAWEQCVILKELLKKYEEKSPDFFITDITHHFYDKDKESLKLKAEYVPGVLASKVELINPITKTPRKIPITLGLDVPGRNALKKLEKEQVKIEIVAWVEGGTGWRYASVITCKTGRAVYSGAYTNLLLEKIK